MMLAPLLGPREMSGIETVNRQISQPAQRPRVSRNVAVRDILEQDAPVMKYGVAAEEVAPAITVHKKADHVTGMAGRLEDLDHAMSNRQLVAIAENSRHRTGSESNVRGIDPRAFGGSQTDSLLIARLQGGRGAGRRRDLQLQTIPKTARSSSMVEMAVCQQQKPDALQRDAVELQVLNQAFGFDAATGIDQGELASAIDGVDVAIVVVRQRTTEKTAGDEMNATRNLQSRRSFE